ncbi:MAG: hypothetical protein NC300_08950 [Bacteroidales bacterium]|nr:hypothetical protein [Clostridium sp.]MCM1204257.1 hypothetical protein [Bacteroidales bacterium]
MNQKVSEAYILTPLEFNILAAGKDIPNIVALQQQAAQLEERDVCYAMDTLYRQRLIRKAEEGFQVETELADILDGIAKAEFLLLAKSQKRDSGIIYFGEKVVCAEQSQADQSALKLYTLEKKETLALIEGWMQKEEQQIYRNIPDGEELPLNILKKSSVLEKSDWEKLPGIIVILEGVSCRNRQVVKRLAVYQREGEKQFIYIQRGNMRKGKYERTQLIAIVKDMVEEEAYDIG